MESPVSRDCLVNVSDRGRVPQQHAVAVISCSFYFSKVMISPEGMGFRDRSVRTCTGRLEVYAGQMQAETDTSTASLAEPLCFVPSVHMSQP